MDRVLTVARRELRAYFDHATAYILLVIFFVVAIFFFFRDAYLMGEATLRPLFGLLPWLLLFFVPAVSMRSLAEERREGTLEHVLSQPITELEFLVGKYLGVVGFLAVALAGTLGLPLGLSLGADLRWGVVVAQYAGSLLLVAGLTAIGLWASSVTRNQVTAFILGVAASFLFYLLSLDVVLLGLPGPLSEAAARLGVLTHFERIARGVLDFRDVVYFVSLAAAFLALTYYSLLRDRLSREREAYRNLVAGTAGLVGVAIVASLAGGLVRARLDLTPGNVYTLSEASREVVSGLNDIVTLHLFTSPELPPQIAGVRRDIEDLLDDYDAAGGDDVRVIRHAPQGEDEAAQEARRLGVPPIQFNVLGDEEFQVRQGYLGIAIEYAGESEALPVVRQTGDLEYRLTSAIRSLTAEDLPVVAFLSGHGERDPMAEMRQAYGRLSRDYSVQTLRLDTVRAAPDTAAGAGGDTAAADIEAAAGEIGADAGAGDGGAGEAGTGPAAAGPPAVVPDSVDVLVVAGPERPFPAADGAALEAFLDRGGSLFLLLPGVDVDRGTTFAVPVEHPVLDSLLRRRYGISVPQSLAFDLQSNARVSLSGAGGLSYVVPYPAWPRVLPAAEHPALEGVSSLVLPWPSPVDTAGADTASVRPLWTTTQVGGRLEAPTSVGTDRDWRQVAEGLAPQVTAVALSPEGDAGRAVLVGDADFVADEFLQGSPGNLLFFQNAVDWLAQDEALIAIRGKERAPPPLLFPSELVRDGVKWGNLVGVPLLFVLLGVVRLARRRGLQRRTWERRVA